MASTGPYSPWCLKHTAVVSIIRSHFNASLAVVVLSTFIVPGLVLVLVTIVSRLFAKDKALGQTAILPSDSDTSPPANEDDTTNTDVPTSKKSKIRKPQLMAAFKWIACTTLLASAASLYSFQILLILFVRQCLGVYMSDLAFMCVDAAIGGIVVLVGTIAWLIITMRFTVESALWCWTIISRAATPKGQSTSEDRRNTTVLGDLERSDERVMEEDRTRSPTSTLPPYMV